MYTFMILCWLVVKGDVAAGVDHAFLHGFGGGQRTPGAESLNEYAIFIVFFHDHILHLAGLAGIQVLGLYLHDCSTAKNAIFGSLMLRSCLFKHEMKIFVDNTQTFVYIYFHEGGFISAIAH